MNVMEDTDMVLRVLGVRMQIETIALPMSVRGVTRQWGPGDYLIVLNDKYDMLTLRRTMQHELWHIINADFARFDNGEDLNLIEARAHAFVAQHY